MKQVKELFLAFCTLATAVACNQTPTNISTGQTNVGDAKPNSELQGKSFSISTTAYYQATLASPNSAQKTVSLTLEPGGSVRMITKEINGTSPFVVDTGEWTTQNSGNLMLNLRRVGADLSTQLEFETDDDKLVYKGTAYGADGLKLVVASPPTND